MGFWFLKDGKRLARERREIESLQATMKWLLGAEWSIDEKNLVINADIDAHGHIYQVALTYPDFFPATPPYVAPKESDVRWSDHQYSNGTLCLEWGPDNWNPEVTGAQILESTYRLLEAENPLGKNEHGVVPSRHFLTTGQSLRNKALRIHVTTPISTYLTTLREKESGQATVKYVAEKSALVYHLVKVNDFINEPLPEPFDDSCVERLWLVYRSSATSEQINAIKTIEELQVLIRQQDDIKLTLTVPDGENTYSGLLLINSEGTAHSYFLTEKQLYKVAVILDENTNQRTPELCQGLNDKRIAIIGLGSVGSKVAETLCRMGARNFYLVDEDLFLVGNLERHSLDWRNIGFHKVDAITNKLKYILPKVKVDKANINLTGQESNAFVNGTLIKISTCDVIVDATANSQIFNLLASISSLSEKPLAWAEVYAGGIGGLIARSRPGKDPKPQIMRQAYHQFTVDAPRMENKNPAPYTLENSDGQVHIASDADVSIIAHHLARFVVDTVSNQNETIFPYSMYLIGLSQGWIFSQPFDTQPIQTDHLLPDEASDVAIDTEAEDNNIDFLMKLLEKTND